VRIYVLSTLSGALEPCGCAKDQLGGLDHLAAFVRKGRREAPNSVMLAAGPLFFTEPVLKKEQAKQDGDKAQTIAEVLKDLGLAAWAPGFNDWADGTKRLATLAGNAGATLLGAKLSGIAAKPHKLITIGKLKVGVFGISDPRDRAGKAPAGVSAPPSAEFVTLAKAGVAALKKQGAQLLIGLTAVQRGAALRIAEAIPELNVLIVGQSLSAGKGDTAQPPPELIGSTLVVETANHGQTVAVVDVHVRGEAKGIVKLADAGGVKRAAKIGSLSTRIRKLESRINAWEKGGKAKAADLKARKADLAKLRGERKQLEAELSAPKGSFFRYSVKEVRTELGSDKLVSARMRTFYKAVNEHNKKAFADLKPLPAAEGEASFAGVDSCNACHSEAVAYWEKTPHAHAYKTLVDEFKEYNLECVGCHVTGYGKPGGSTVTFNDTLRNVQCETCHGPGSKHVASEGSEEIATAKPDTKRCVEQCHHPPHVTSFDKKERLERIIGPGHGMPSPDPK